VSVKVQTPLGNQTTPKHVIQCKKYGDTPKNVFSRALSFTQPATQAVSNVNKQQLPVARQLRMRTASFYLAADNNRRNEAHLSR